MPGPLTQQAIEGNSLPLPRTWADTIGLKDYWERVEAAEIAKRELEACELDAEVDAAIRARIARALDECDAIPDPDELEQDGFAPGYDITDG